MIEHDDVFVSLYCLQKPRNKIILFGVHRAVKHHHQTSGITTRTSWGVYLRYLGSLMCEHFDCPWTSWKHRCEAYLKPPTVEQIIS